jgi:hypothetical protein
LNEKTDLKVTWIILLSLVLVLIGIISCSFLWDYLSKDFTAENEAGLARVGFIPIEATVTPAENITSQKIDLVKYFENPEKYDVDLLIIGDSFSQAGRLPEYMATKSDMQVLAIRSAEVEPAGDYTPINLLIALDNGGVIDTIHPDCIILETVPRLVYQESKTVNFTSNLTHEELNRAVFKFYGKKQKPVPGVLKNQSVMSNQQNITQNNTARDTKNQLISVDIFSKDKKWKDPAQNYLEQANGNLINFRQMLVSLVWLQVYDHTYPTKKQPQIIYRFYLDTPLFSSERDAYSLYVISGDLSFTNYLNDQSWLYKYNHYLNSLEDRLAKKNITFYFMPAVDKFDFYYPRIKNNKYPVNPFYENFENQYKSYYYINTKSILERKLENNQKDIFWLGDTHWSWKAVESIATEISPLERLEPRVFSLNKSIQSLPPDLKILNSFADGLQETGDYRSASQIRIKVFEEQNGILISHVQLVKPAANESKSHTFGSVESFISHEDIIELSGWAIDPVWERAANNILITDNDDNIICFVKISKQRPDISGSFNNNKLLVSGWTALIDTKNLTPASFPLNAYVISTGQNIAYPIPTTKRLQTLMINYYRNLSVRS